MSTTCRRPLYSTGCGHVRDKRARVGIVAVAVDDDDAKKGHLSRNGAIYCKLPEKRVIEYPPKKRFVAELNAYNLA